jgi:hypothetical protein
LEKAGARTFDTSKTIQYLDRGDQRSQAGRNSTTFRPKEMGPVATSTNYPGTKGLDSRIRRETIWDGHSELSNAITSLAVLVPAEDNVNKPEAEQAQASAAQASAAQESRAQARGAQASAALASAAQASGTQAIKAQASGAQASAAQASAVGRVLRQGRESREPWKYIDTDRIMALPFLEHSLGCATLSFSVFHPSQ